MSSRLTCGCKMPCGRSERILAMASRTSLTARSIGVPMANCTMVRLLPSETVLFTSSTPVMLRTAASTRCVTWFSSSSGAAPGCATMIIAPGNSISGWLLMSIARNERMPASISSANSTSGGTGFLIDQAEILRIVGVSCRNQRVAGAASTGLIVSPGFRKAPALATTRSAPVRPEATPTPASLIAPTSMLRRSTFLSLPST